MWPSASNCAGRRAGLGEDYTVEKETSRLGRHVIHWDAIHLRDVPWKPQLS